MPMGLIRFATARPSQANLQQTRAVAVSVDM